MSNFRRTFTKEQKLEIVKQSLEESAVIEDLAAQYKIHSHGKTLNEDNTYTLHVTPSLRKHFIGGSPHAPRFIIYSVIVQ
jgi:hypothetical protein